MRQTVNIVGGGVIGLSVAFEARSKGWDVRVFDQSNFGGQASGAAAGMLAPYSEVEEDPDAFFVLCQESLKLFPQWKKRVVDAGGMDFEYMESGSLHAFFHEADVLAAKTTMAWQKKFQVDSELWDGRSLAERVPALSSSVLGAVYRPEEAHIYAPDYVKSLHRACLATGVECFEHRKVTPTAANNGDIIVKSRCYEADVLVICSGAWAKEWEDTLSLEIPVYPIRGQICAYRGAPGALPHIVFSSQGYLVQKGDGTIVAGATEDIAGFETSVTEKGVGRLLRWVPKVMPSLEGLVPFHQWAGLRPATMDGYPLLGHTDDCSAILFACGHYRNGILLSPVTAKLIGELLTKISMPRDYEVAFHPGRFNRK
ncbi:glycine oxidase [Aureibacillus halotolerans]|uniref:glycine oxidase n=1 Tax=Aureibacillus halotolerans TaxID=1508390 RepID=A0A4R6UAH0_9BACI|nr:glycine oxidase ThiO [Aureibacillus halotolerans]TDQ41685.1 glycine oxidase [Aureibacillus halotolerans]